MHGFTRSVYENDLNINQPHSSIYDHYGYKNKTFPSRVIWMTEDVWLFIPEFVRNNDRGYSVLSYPPRKGSDRKSRIPLLVTKTLRAWNLQIDYSSTQNLSKDILGVLSLNIRRLIPKYMKGG